MKAPLLEDCLGLIIRRKQSSNNGAQTVLQQWGLFGPYYQTQRKALYQQYAHQLIASGHAYRCYCTPERLAEMRKEQEAQKLPPRYDRRCRYLSEEERAANEAAGLKWVVRFAMPLEGETVVHDELHGDIVFKNSDLDDTVILKSDGLPTYHLGH